LKEAPVGRRPKLPTDGEPRTRLTVIPTAKFSEFPYDTIARYVNHKVLFTVEHDPYTPVDPMEVATPWIVRKLS
jgi:hypothetical protein